MPEDLFLTRQQGQEMLTHILTCLPEEACGLISGCDGRAERVFPITNEAHSPVRFRMEPQEQVNAMLWLEKNDKELVAIFHSHPTGPPLPSETDIAEFAYPGSVTLIWAPQEEIWQARAFLLEKSGVKEISIQWIEDVQ